MKVRQVKCVIRSEVHMELVSCIKAVSFFCCFVLFQGSSGFKQEDLWGDIRKLLLFLSSNCIDLEL